MSCSDSLVTPMLMISSPSTNVMVGYVYYPTTGALPSSSDTAIKISTSAGTVIGQLGFGFLLADHLGRKNVRFLVHGNVSQMYGIELMIIIFATLALSLSAQGPAVSIVGVMMFWRVISGSYGSKWRLSSRRLSPVNLRL